MLAGPAAPATAAQDILIGGGPTAGVSHRVALQVCDLMNEYAGDGYRCVGRPTPGPAFTLRAVDLALLDFGVARADRTVEAVTGRGDWLGEPLASLRSVFGIPPEAVLLATGAAAAADLVHDLVRTVFENLDAPTNAHAAFRRLDPGAMLKGLPAPLHPGAARYYRERGWL